MPIQPFTFGVDSRPGKFGPDGGGRLINAYVEQAPNDHPVPFISYCRPGLKTFASALGGTIGFRGGISLGATGLVAVSQEIHEIDATGAKLNTSGFAGVETVSFAKNRQTPLPQVAIAGGGSRAIWQGGVLTEIADTDLKGASDVIHQGQYFIWLIANTDEFQISGLLDGTSYNSLDFATAEAKADQLIGGAEYGQQIILFGENSTEGSIEFWFNSGASSFPFERVQNTTLSLGCMSKQTIVKIVHSDQVAFVASDATVRLFSGKSYQPQRVSHPDVEKDIDALADKDELGAWSFTIEGHTFYVLSSLTWTWALDLSTGLWSEWMTGNSGRWKAEGFVEIGGKRITGDSADPNLYEIDADTFDDAGEHLIWKLRSGPVGGYPNRIIADEIFVNMVPGVGLNTTDSHEQDPQAILRVSDDDGVSWSNEITAPIGKIGEKSIVTSFTGLGASQEDGFRFELSASAAVIRAMTSSSIRFTALKP